MGCAVSDKTACKRHEQRWWPSCSLCVKRRRNAYMPGWQEASIAAYWLGSFCRWAATVILAPKCDCYGCTFGRQCEYDGHDCAALGCGPRDA
jgi:hypothetical protein